MSWATENVTAGTHRVFRFADCRLSGLSGASSWVPSKTPATSARRSPRRGRQAASVCGAGRADRAPDDEPWREHHLPGRRTSLFQPLNGGRHGVLGLLLRVLADGGQVHVRQPGQWAVVVSHDRDRPWHADAGSVERVKEPHGTAIVERQHRRGKLRLAKQCGGGAQARLLGMVSGDDVDAVSQPMPAHRRAVAAPAIPGMTPVPPSM